MELFTPDFGLVFWMFVAFIILFFILAKWGWPIILKNIDSRADNIDRGVEYARQAKEQLDSARDEAKKYIDEAQKRQAEMLNEVSKMRSQLVEDAKADAAREAKKVIDAANLAIEQSRKKAELEFKNEVSKFSLEIAEKMLRTQLKSDKAQTDLVNKMLDEIEKN